MSSICFLRVWIIILTESIHNSSILNPYLLFLKIFPIALQKSLHVQFHRRDMTTKIWQPRYYFIQDSPLLRERVRKNNNIIIDNDNNHWLVFNLSLSLVSLFKWDWSVSKPRVCLRVSVENNDDMFWCDLHWLGLLLFTY